MVNYEHLLVVQKGSVFIEEWRRIHPKDTFDLEEAYVPREFDLSYSNLSDANLRRAVLEGVNLSNANLSSASLGGANLAKAKLISADLSNVKAPNTNFNGADLNHALLHQGFFIDANFSYANLTKVDAAFALFDGCDFFKTNFTKTSLIMARFRESEFLRCNFSNSNLLLAVFENVTFRQVNFSNATFSSTIFVDCCFDGCKKLEDAKHHQRSFIDYTTLKKTFEKSGDGFTSEMEIFLQNAGLPKELLRTLPEILAADKYHSCFVCYGEPDRAFAEKLVKDLKRKGVACWIYPMDYTPGERTWSEITCERRRADKVIVLCSAKALIRDGVLKEIEDQIDENPNKIIPVSLDNLWKEEGFIVKRGRRDLKPFLLERNYVDFCDTAKYSDSLNKLLKGLIRKKKGFKVFKEIS